MPHFGTLITEIWLKLAKNTGKSIDKMGVLCYSLFSLAVKVVCQIYPNMTLNAYEPRIPAKQIARRIFVITLASAVLSVSLPAQAVAAGSADMPVPSFQAHEAVQDEESYHFEVPAYTTVTVLRAYDYVPMTAYTSRPEETDDTPFITADGSRVRDGIVASNFLPFGTKVRIPELFGDKIFEVHDRMNKRYVYKLDVWMEKLPEARKFGVRYARIEIVKTATNK